MKTVLSKKLREDVLTDKVGVRYLRNFNLADFKANPDKYLHLPPWDSLEEDVRWQAADEIDRLTDQVSNLGWELDATR